jgi:hypothetical protein
VLEQQQGEPDAARAAYRQAIATGHADHAPWRRSTWACSSRSRASRTPPAPPTGRR